MVKTCGGVVVVPTVMLPNWKALLDGLMTGAVPVPLKLTVNGVGFELAIVSVALRVPDALGVKVTLIVQFAPAVRLEVQEVVCEKSPALTPVTVMPVIESVAAPAAFDSVTV